jgi:hypothetical protein
MPRDVQQRLPGTRAAAAERVIDPDVRKMSQNEFADWLAQQTSVDLWPTTGRALGLSKPSTYRGASKGEIRCIRVGRRYIVSARWLATALGLEGEEVER